MSWMAAGGAMRLSLPDALSLFRLFAVLPLVSAIVAGQWPVSALIFGAAVASDFLDGPLARRGGKPRAGGALLDHGADACFVTAGLGALAWRGLVPGLLPVMVALAFAQYAWDSGAHRGGALRGNAIGRINGIAYYALVGAWLVVEMAAPSTRPILNAFALGLIGTTAFSMSQRARLARRAAQ